MTHEQIPKEFYDAVEKAARDISRKWPTIDWEDTRQDIWVQLLERPNQLAQALEEEDPGVRLRKLAAQSVAEEINTYEFFSGQYEYGTDEVRTLLEMGLITNREVATLTESTDLSTGMLMLKDRNKGQFNIIVDKYVYDIEQPDRKSVTRAIDALTTLMNRVNTSTRYTDHQGPGARKVGVL